MKKIISYLKSLTAEQIFSLCLFIGCFLLMLVCAIARLFSVLWFAIDLSAIPVPNQFLQDRIMNLLFIIELSITYKILCRTRWTWCIWIAILQTILIHFIPTNLIANVINLVFIFIIPLLFIRKWYVLLDSLFVYILMFLYSALFLIARTGNIDINGAYNFIYGVLTSIDTKLFIATLYLYIKNFGGVKLWKNQKRLICQRDLSENEL